MTNPELAEWLNLELGLAGGEAVTTNIIRQWVAWDVLPKASARGREIGRRPIWTRPETAKRRARRLAELRTAGVKREAAVIVQAFIEWGHPDGNRVRSALRKEVEKWRKQLDRQRTTRMNDGDFSSLSAVKKRALRKQLGPLAPRFIGTQFQQSDEFYAVQAYIAESGKTELEIYNPIILASFSKMLGIETASSQLRNEAFSSITAGLFGDPEIIENSATSEIDKSSDNDLRRARVAVKRLFRAINHAGRLVSFPGIPASVRALLQELNSLSSQISTGPWAVYALAACLLAVRRVDKCPEIALDGGDFEQLGGIFSAGFANAAL